MPTETRKGWIIASIIVPICVALLGLIPYIFPKADSQDSKAPLESKVQTSDKTDKQEGPKKQHQSPETPETYEKPISEEDIEVKKSNTKIFSAEGVGFPPDQIKNRTRRQALAKRAATVIAKRNLCEKIHGMVIQSKTLVKNLQLEDDSIQSVNTFVMRNYRIISEEKVPDSGFKVVAAVEIKVMENH